MRTRLARASATFFGETAFSVAVPPVAGGTTDLGEIALSSPGCVVGTLTYDGSCRFGPVTSTVELALLDENGQWQPIDLITPDAVGNFCATLRRRLVYRLREEDVACDCPATAVCEAITSPTRRSVQCSLEEVRQRPEAW